VRRACERTKGSWQDCLKPPHPLLRGTFSPSRMGRRERGGRRACERTKRLPHQMQSMSYKPRVTRANSARRTTPLDILTMGMSMRTADVGMVGQVAICIMCRNPVTTAAPDYTRFMGALLIDGMAFAHSRIHAAMGHRHLTLGWRIADRTRGRQVALAHRPPVRKHAVSSTFIGIKRHFSLL
jgi:hypothetical protein